MFEEIKKAQVEQKLRTLVATGVVMNPQQFAKSFTKDELSVMDQDMIEKAMNHKYFKREGTPGNYKYYYTEAEYKQAKGERGKEFKYGEINQEDLDVNDKVYVDTYNDYLHGEKKPNNKQHEDASRWAREQLKKHKNKLREQPEKKEQPNLPKELKSKLEDIVSNPPENFYEKVAEYFGEPDDDGESESALVDRIASHGGEKVNKFLDEIGDKGFKNFNFSKVKFGDIIEYIEPGTNNEVKEGVVKDKNSTLDEDFVILENGKNIFISNISGVKYK